MVKNNSKIKLVVWITVGVTIFGSVVVLGSWWVGSIKAQANVENTLDQVSDNVFENKKIMNTNTKDIIKLDKRVSLEEEKSSALEKQLDRMDGKLDQIIRSLIE